MNVIPVETVVVENKRDYSDDGKNNHRMQPSREARRIEEVG